MAEPFEQRVHVIDDLGSEFLIGVIAKQTDSVLIPVDEPEPEVQQRYSDSITSPQSRSGVGTSNFRKYYYRNPYVLFVENDEIMLPWNSDVDTECHRDSSSKLKSPT